MSSHGFNDISHHSYTGPNTDKTVNRSIPESTLIYGALTAATPEHRSPASQLCSERLVYSCRVDVKPDAWPNVKQRDATSNGRRPQGFAFLSFIEHCITPLPLHTQLLNTSECVCVIKDRRVAILG